MVFFFSQVRNDRDAKVAKSDEAHRRAFELQNTRRLKEKFKEQFDKDIVKLQTDLQALHAIVCEVHL